MKNKNKFLPFSCDFSCVRIRTESFATSPLKTQSCRGNLSLGDAWGVDGPEDPGDDPEAGRPDEDPGDDPLEVPAIWVGENPPFSFCKKEEMETIYDGGSFYGILMIFCGHLIWN